MNVIFFARYAVKVEGTSQTGEIAVSATKLAEAKTKAREEIRRRCGALPLWVSISSAR
jgi:hypothetical protein